MRLVELDERIFQHERLELGIHHDDVEVVDLGGHGGHLGGMIASKIAGDPVFQGFCLAHVDHLAALVQHDVHTGQQRQAVGLFPQFFQLCHWVSASFLLPAKEGSMLHTVTVMITTAPPMSAKTPGLSP